LERVGAMEYGRSRLARRGTRCARTLHVHPLQWHHAGLRVSAAHRGMDGTRGGGDFYTLSVRSPGQISVVIGDTCGRGVDGEAHLSRILPKVHQLAFSGASPAQLLAELNRTVAVALPADRFVTAAAFELDMRVGLLTVANAAHVPAIIRKGRGRQVSIVGHATGIPLGILPDTTYLDERYELDRGDVIVLMTDGVLEALESDLVRMSTLKRLLAEPHESGAEVYRFLLRKFEERTAGRLIDDMTLMALEATVQPGSWRPSHLARAS
jgi:sigma-B regulation protein RsbU (phosphoserine phosphatase)